MLTVHLRPCEIGVLRDELHRRRSDATQATAELHVRSDRLDGGAGDQDVEEFHGELLLISRLLDDLAVPAPPGQPRQIVGPTWLLSLVIRAAAGEAVDRLGSVVHRFREDTGTPTPDEVRAALNTASAWTATLIGLDHAENHAVEH